MTFTSKVAIQDLFAWWCDFLSDRHGGFTAFCVSPHEVFNAWLVEVYVGAKVLMLLVPPFASSGPLECEFVLGPWARTRTVSIEAFMRMCAVAAVRRA